jgi:hypothetical protein
MNLPSWAHCVMGPRKDRLARVLLSHYYLHYFYLKLLFLFSFSMTIILLIVSSYIISFIAIITLLCALFLSQDIIPIIFFEKHYINYLFPCLLF